MKRLSNILIAFAVGIAAMLCAGSASAQSPQFVQVSPLYFTMPVTSNPLPQTLTIVSTGAAFKFDARAGRRIVRPRLAIPTRRWQATAMRRTTTPTPPVAVCCGIFIVRRSSCICLLYTSDAADE